MKEALLYSKKKDNSVNCNLCNHKCNIEEGKRGVCGVRENKNGTLYSLNYGQLIAQNVDPIEKKPFYHFLKDTYSFSIAAPGCNFSCLFCQNNRISQISKQDGVDWKELCKESTPEEVIKKAKDNNCKSIAYTYTEPTIFFEFAFDCMKLAHKKDLKNVWVSNGYFTQKAFLKMKKYLDAVNIDLKGFSNSFYTKFCKAKIEPVKENIKRIAKDENIHLEITSLIIPDLNDSKKEITQIADFIKNLDPEIPWHISKFFPAHKLADKPPTPLETLKKAERIGRRKGLKNVHLGNI